MNTNVKQFAKKYLRALEDSNAAIFAGAGLSIPAGFVNWKQLLAEAAEELNLEIDKEDDLVSLAQYYVNEKGNRSAINQKLIDEFTKDATVTDNLKILSKLPIPTFWTTNYDKAIEDALRQEKKAIDVKITSANLAQSVPKRDVVLYKMHGDVSQPQDAVLTKDDYENYNSTRKLFTTALQGDLVSKTFLFIGFSFDDPNLQYILSRIRVLLGENQREHYCFFKNPSLSDFSKPGISSEEASRQCEYTKLKLSYKIKDLKRYSIQAIMIDEYSEITEALQYIYKRLKAKRIFISGAAAEYGEWKSTKVNEFVFNLSKLLVSKNNKVITGFGIGIGSSVINGALSSIYASAYQHIEEGLIMRPFPQLAPDGVSLAELWTKYRTEILSQAGIAIFMFGNKEQGGSVIESNGMLEEFEVAKKNGVFPIPVGCTGYVAKKIWYEVMENPEQFGYTTKELKGSLQSLNDPEITHDQLLINIFKIINQLQ